MWITTQSTQDGHQPIQLSQVITWRYRVVKVKNSQDENELFAIDFYTACGVITWNYRDFEAYSHDIDKLRFLTGSVILSRL